MATGAWNRSVRLAAASVARKVVVTLGLVGAAGALGGCSGGSGPVALFSVAASAAEQQLASTPWPSDLFRDDTGHVALSSLPTQTVDVTSRLLELVHEADGFGVTTGAYFPVSALVDEASLAGHVHLIDVEDGSELLSETLLRGADRPARIFARARNGGTLLESHTYAWVLSRKITGPSGALRPSEDMQKLLNQPQGDLSRLLMHVNAGKLVEDGAPLTLPDLALVSTFTTQTITAELVAARAQLDQAPVATITRVYAADRGTADGTLDELLGTPTSLRPGLDNPGGIAHDHLAFVVQGTFASPNFLSSDATLTGAGGTASSVGLFDVSSGAPLKRGMATVPFTLVLPKQASGSYAQQKVAIFQHGLGADRSAVLSVANGLAARGIATLGIDIPFHGSRSPTATDASHRFGGSSRSLGADGWAEWSDEPSFQFFNVMGNPTAGVIPFDPSATRAAFQQAVVDIMQEVQLLRQGDWRALQTREPRLADLAFDTAHLAYSGESFGGMMGGITLGIEPNLEGGVLDVPGGGLIFPLLLNSGAFGPIFGTLLEPGLGTYVGELPADTDFAFNVYQFTLERGDPLAYAPYLQRRPLPGAKAKSVLQMHAHFDETVPNVSNQALARAIGLTPVAIPDDGVAPVLAHWPDAPQPVPAPMTAPTGGVLSAFVEFDPASHVFLTAQRGYRRYDLSQPQPHPRIDPPQLINNPIERAQEIFGTVLQSLVAGQPPTVVPGN
jgi:hypothetical protein